MSTAGQLLLFVGLATAVFGAVASLYGARTGDRRWTESGRRAVLALAGVCVTTFGILELAYLRDDFAFDLVASSSSSTTPLFYKSTALWSTQEGSLLLWVTLLSVWSALVLHLTRRRMREVAPYAAAVLLGFAAFFLTMLAFVESPFATSPAPPEGAGLNPLLRHPGMMIHPPMLYSGYTLFAIPFAFAIGALVTRRVGPEWIRETRAFTLAAWSFLGVGIMLGARWSYSELGWGGYWAWDPVENASLLPWLTGTALLHSVMVQEKRGMLKVWNVSLVLATGTLCILGTFLVRSGILDSIHAFGASTLGPPFLVLIGVLAAGSVYLVATRSALLRSDHHLASWWSREAIFLLNNLVLVGVAVVVLWGTFLPIISEAVLGRERAVQPGYWDVVVPLAIVLVFLSGLAPLVAWRRMRLGPLARALAVPGALFAAALVAGVVLAGTGSISALLLFGFAAFALGSVGQELVKGTRARRIATKEALPVAVVQLVRRNRRRYGGYLVHAGIALLFVGIAASSAFQQKVDARITQGQTTKAGGYAFTYKAPTTDLNDERLVFGARVEVRKDGELVGTVNPERGYYASRDPSLGVVGRFFEGESTSEVALDAGWFEDVWVAVDPDVETAFSSLIEEADRRFADADGAVLGTIVGALAARYEQQPPVATFRIIVSPLVTWIWIGAIVTLLGALVAVWPAPRSQRREVRAPLAGRVAREVKAAEDDAPERELTRV